MRVLAVWLILMMVEVIHGTLRTLLLAPRVGDFAARQVSVFTGSLLILLTTYLLMGWMRILKRSALVQVGVVWLVLTVAFELGIGHYVAGRSWVNLASDFKIWEGGLLPVGLIVLTAAPYIAARWRGLLRTDVAGV